jgi:hypothetical protein
MRYNFNVFIAHTSIFRNANMHIHTHTHIYIYTYIYTKSIHTYIVGHAVYNVTKSLMGRML